MSKLRSKIYGKKNFVNYHIEQLAKPKLRTLQINFERRKNRLTMIQVENFKRLIQNSFQNERNNKLEAEACQKRLKTKLKSTRRRHGQKKTKEANFVIKKLFDNFKQTEFNLGFTKACFYSNLSQIDCHGKNSNWDEKTLLHGQKKYCSDLSNNRLTTVRFSCDSLDKIDDMNSSEINDPVTLEEISFSNKIDILMSQRNSSLHEDDKSATKSLADVTIDDEYDFSNSDLSSEVLKTTAEGSDSPRKIPSPAQSVQLARSLLYVPLDNDKEFQTENEHSNDPLSQKAAESENEFDDTPRVTSQIHQESSTIHSSILNKESVAIRYLEVDVKEPSDHASSMIDDEIVIASFSANEVMEWKNYPQSSQLSDKRENEKDAPKTFLPLIALRKFKKSDSDYNKICESLIRVSNQNIDQVYITRKINNLQDLQIFHREPFFNRSSLFQLAKLNDNCHVQLNLLPLNDHKGFEAFRQECPSSSSITEATREKFKVQRFDEISKSISEIQIKIDVDEDLPEGTKFTVQKL